MATLRTVVVVLALVSGCSDQSPKIDFVGLDDGSVIGGPQVTTVDPDLDEGATHVDLYLDGERIGADDFSPFAFEWDTRDHREGDAELRAQVMLSDGTTAERSIDIVVDNTPPVVDGLPQSLEYGTPYNIHVRDANRIVLVEVTAADLSERFEDPPYLLIWSGVCGDDELTIRAVDEAGWETTWTSLVTTSDVNDQDCDGYRWVDVPNGSDCDDSNPAIHPGQVDLGPDGDVNCDGVPGTDADGDGLAGVGQGGRDCDDSDPEIHPGGTLYESSKLLDAEGLGVWWDRGTAGLAVTDQGIAMAINRYGSVELVTEQPGGDWRAEVVAENVDAGPIAFVADGADLSIVYVVGNSLGASLRRDGVWTDESVLSSATFPRRPMAVLGSLNGLSTTAVATTDDESVYLATRTEAGWTTQLIETPDGYPFLVDVEFNGFGFVVSYFVGSSVHRARWDGLNAPVVDTIGEAPSFDPYTVCVDPTFDTVYGLDPTGCLVRSDDPTPLSPCFEGWVRLFCAGSDVYVQPEDGLLGHFEPFTGSFEYLPVTADVVGRQAAAPLFARPGVVFRPGRSIPAPADPIDGVDRDCDGED